MTVQLELFQFAGPVEGAYNAVIKKFEEKYPNIKIKQNIVPDALKLLDMRMASGDYPDLFAIGNSPSFQNFANNGKIVDLTNEGFMKNVNSKALDLIDIDGKKYGFPAVFNTIGVYYNKRIFAEQGIVIPKTKDELVAAARKLQSAGIVPFVFPDKDAPSINALDFQAYSGLYTDNPEQIFEDAMAGKLHLYESDPIRKAAQTFVDLRMFGKDSVSITLDDGFNQFASEKVAMMPYVTLATGAISHINPKLDFSIFPLPSDHADKIKVPFGIGFQLAISLKSKYVKEAKQFLEFWSQPENAALFESIEMAPSTISGVQSTTKQTELMRSYIEHGKMFPWPGEPGWDNSQKNDVASNAQFLAQSKNVDEFLKGIDSLFYKVKK